MNFKKIQAIFIEKKTKFKENIILLIEKSWNKIQLMFVWSKEWIISNVCEVWELCCNEVQSKTTIKITNSSRPAYLSIV
jgi:hypothetical protein